jgi:hypothetical protein
MLAGINAYIKTHVSHTFFNRMANIKLALNGITPTACRNSSQQVEVYLCARNHRQAVNVVAYTILMC